MKTRTTRSAPTKTTLSTRKRTRGKAPPPRAPLSRERLVRVAIEVADAGGLDALSMRALAELLGVVPMAAYKHVPSKDALLDAMVDAVFDELAIGQGEGWREVLRERAIGMRQALRRHPWAIGLMEARTPGPANLRHHDATMACLREKARLPIRPAIRCYSVMDAYIYGFALQERTLPFETAEQSADVAVTRLEGAGGVAGVPYPYLVEIAGELARSGYDYDEQFLLGLELVLDGVAQLVAPR